MLKPEGTSRVSSQLCLSREVVTLPQDGLNEWATRRIRMTGTAGCTMAETRIVECIPQGVGRSIEVGQGIGVQVRQASMQAFRRIVRRPGGSLPPPGPR